MVRFISAAAARLHASIGFDIRSSISVALPGRTVAVMACVSSLLLNEPTRAAERIAPEPARVIEPAARSKVIQPGKVDFHYRHLSAIEENRYNAFLWTPSFKGGGGVFAPRDGTTLGYGGGFLRPFAAWPELGDLIVGGHVVTTDLRQDHELQAEYRLPMGLGFGGGIVQTLNPATDVRFGKVTMRGKLKEWNYIVALQLQEFGERTSPGGYLAVYNDEWMLVGGTDGEQWRVTAGYIAPENDSLFRIAAEMLYVDNRIGLIEGPRSLFGNLTLKYEGGFLSHPARLGRAMGPQGLEFGNPLGFLVPTWNRRLEVWELGRLGGARVERIEIAENVATERYEALVFPFQFARTNNFLDGFFVGGAYLTDPLEESFSWLAGYFGSRKSVRVFAGVEHGIESEETSIVIGGIHTF